MCVSKSYGGLGFRNLARFNIALLAKQGWRLVTQPNSLLVRVLKAKHFPSSDFMSSNLKVGASYAWKSLWATKKVLQEGLGWRVGTGSALTL